MSEDWKFEGKIAYCAEGAPSRPMKGTLTYSRETGKFKLTLQNRHRIFDKTRMNLNHKDCPAGRKYLLKAEDGELHFYDLEDKQKKELHAFLLAEIGFTRGSIKKEVITTPSSNSFEFSRSSAGSSVGRGNISSNRSSFGPTSKTSHVQPDRISFKNEDNDPNFMELANYVKNGPVGVRKRAGIHESGQPIAISNNINNSARKNDFQSSVTSQQDAASRTRAPKTIFDKKPNKSSFWGVIRKTPRDLSEFTKRAKYDTNTNATPKSSKRSSEDKFNDIAAEYYPNPENIINNVFSTTFRNLNSSSQKDRVNKQSTQPTGNDAWDMLFDDTKENILDEPKVQDVKPVQLLRPPKWADIHEEFYRPDFWDYITTMHGLRSGNLGEWVKGLDEQLTIKGLLTLKDGEWLNADIIDVCFRNICLHYNKVEGRRVEPITTLAILSYQGKRKLPSKWYWNLAEVDLVVAPVHLNNSHWATVVIHVAQKKIILYDSLNHRRTSETKQQFLDTIIEIMTSIAEQQDLPEFKHGWEATEDFDVPQQDNGIDCGIFSILFAAYAVLGWEMDFRQAHIPFFRRKFCSDLIQDIILFAHRKQEAGEELMDITEVDEEEGQEQKPPSSTETSVHVCGESPDKEGASSNSEIIEDGNAEKMVNHDVAEETEVTENENAEENHDEVKSEGNNDNDGAETESDTKSVMIIENNNGGAVDAESLLFTPPS